MGFDRTPASQIIESLTLQAVYDKVSADERKEVVRRAQGLFAEGCPRTRNPPRQSRRDKGANMSSTTKASTEIGWLARRRSIVTAAAKLPMTHVLVGSGHMGAALPGTRNLVGAGHVGAALPGAHNLVGGRACRSRRVAAGSWARAAEVLGQASSNTTRQREEEAFHMSCVLGSSRRNRRMQPTTGSG